MQDKNAKIRKIIQIVTLTIAAIVTILLCFYIARLYDEENMQSFEDLVTSFGVWGVLFMFALQVVQVVLAVIPGEPVELLFGALYGTLWGTLLCIAGIICGTALIYILVQKLGKSFVEKIIDSKQFQKIKVSEKSCKAGYIYVFPHVYPGNAQRSAHIFCTLHRNFPPAYVVHRRGSADSFHCNFHICGKQLCTGKSSEIHYYICGCRCDQPCRYICL